LFSFKAEKDFLHKRKFNISLDEVKDGVPNKKTIPDLLTFKDGRLWSDYINKKYGYEWVRYRINKDSVFIDSTETEVRMLEVEGSITDEMNQTVMFNFVVQEWDIEGTIKVTKNDKIKRYFDFVGREKGGKPKKIKAPKKRIIEVKKDDGSIITETLTPPPNK
jgi:hypothetical protein